MIGSRAKSKREGSRGGEVAMWSEWSSIARKSGNNGFPTGTLVKRREKRYTAGKSDKQ